MLRRFLMWLFGLHREPRAQSDLVFDLLDRPLPNGQQIAEIIPTQYGVPHIVIGTTEYDPHTKRHKSKGGGGGGGGQPQQQQQGGKVQYHPNQQQGGKDRPGATFTKPQ
jgi:hypothetical protein